MAIASVEQFVQVLAETPLLADVQRNELAELGSRFTEPDELAEEMISRGWLTSFQADRVLQGDAEGLVFGPYVLLDSLGQGGMGRVYKARHQLMNRIVALKLIRSEYVSLPEAVSRFHREIQAAARLSHPNVVIAHDAAQHENVHFLVTEYVEGNDLAQHIARHGPLPVDEACDCIRQAALGLAHAHDHGLVHRDIKPSNLLRDHNGHVKVADLGLALLLEGTGDESSANITRSGVTLGTPDFMAPEQAADPQSASRQSDIYSLGCTLYYLLVRKPPFPGGSLADKLIRHRESEPVPIEAKRTDVPSALGNIIRRMMAKSPADRFASAHEVAAALAPFSAPHDPIAARHTWPRAIAARPRSQQWIPSKFARRLLIIAILGIPLAGLVVYGIIIKLQLEKGRVSIEIEKTADEPSLDISSIERDIANWALNEMHALWIMTDKTRSQTISAVADIPDGPFHVTAVNFDGRKALGDDELERLKGLSAIDSLYLASTSITDAGLRHLRSFPKLLRLDLAYNSKVTNEGLSHLVEYCPSLKSLGVSRTKVSDEGLPHIAKLNLNWGLYLSGCDISDSGLAHLEGATVGKMIVNATQLSDAGIRSLAHVRGLEELVLQSLHVTADVRTELQNLRKLKQLDIDNSLVTRGDLDAIAEALPQCTVRCDGARHVRRPASPTAEPQSITMNRSEEDLEHDRRTAEWVLSRGGVPMLRLRATGEWAQATNEPMSANGDVPGGYRLPAEPIDLIHVTFPNSAGIENGDLERLAASKELFHINVSNTSVDAAVVAHFAKISSLQSVAISNTKVTSSALTDLSSLPILNRLTIHPNQIDDQWDFLRALPRLRNLEIVDNGPNFAFLAEHTHLRTIFFRKANRLNVSQLAFIQERNPFCRILVGNRVVAGISDPVHKAALQLERRGIVFDGRAVPGGDGGTITRDKLEGDRPYHINTIRLPEKLSLSQEERNLFSAFWGMSREIQAPGLVDADACMPHFVPMTLLERLILNDSDLSDTGLEHLKYARGLRFLDVTNTRATESAIADLQSCLPSCQIKSNFATSSESTTK